MYAASFSTCSRGFLGHSFGGEKEATQREPQTLNLGSRLDYWGYPLPDVQLTRRPQNTKRKRALMGYRGTVSRNNLQPQRYECS